MSDCTDSLGVEEDFNHKAEHGILRFYDESCMAHAVDSSPNVRHGRSYIETARIFAFQPTSC